MQFYIMDWHPLFMKWMVRSTKIQKYFAYFADRYLGFHFIRCMGCSIPWGFNQGGVMIRKKERKKEKKKERKKGNRKERRKPNKKEKKHAKYPYTSYTVNTYLKKKTHQHTTAMPPTAGSCAGCSPNARSRPGAAAPWQARRIRPAAPARYNRPPGWNA